ncbi:MAG: enoyl-CoA hydratase/isomerase family protein [Myxococcales bacterium]
MDLERQGDAALLRINTGKANAINAAWVARMNGALDEVAAAGSHALVVTGSEAFFSAGLDLPELVGLDRLALFAFMESFNAVMLRLFTLPVPVIAAVNGHAIAGGCVLALQADLRVMADGKGRIGLTEVPLGIGLPSLVLETLRAQVPPASLLPIAMEGRLLGPAEALQLGLVHEVVAPGELIPRALAHAARLAVLPRHSVAQVKSALRAPAVAALRATAATESPRWLDLWFSPGGQAGVRAAVARLGKK